mgnify:CR=1 FL=1
MGFLLCDVVGKGLESSFTTIQLHSIFHSKIIPSDSPSKVMEKLNDSIYQLRTQKNHCAAFYIELNPLTNTVKYSDAGNGLSYLVRNGKLISLTEYGGMVLGACQNNTYTEGEITLEDNDFLFLSTDGILDFKNKDSERFGIARVEELIINLSSQEDKRGFLNKEIDYFKQSDDFFPDDITLLMISKENNLKTVNPKNISLLSTSLTQ